MCSPTVTRLARVSGFFASFSYASCTAISHPDFEPGSSQLGLQTPGARLKGYCTSGSKVPLHVCTRWLLCGTSIKLQVLEMKIHLQALLSLLPVAQLHGAGGRSIVELRCPVVPLPQLLVDD